MKTSHMFFITIILAASLSLIACDLNEGSAERAGESLDNAIDDAGDAIEEAGDEIEDSTR